MITKLVEDKDFSQLLDLYVLMYQEMNPDINAFQATNTLIHMINTYPTFKAIGLYDGDILMGFVSGYEGGNNVFYFAGIYLVEKNKEETRLLIEYSFSLIENEKWSAWEVDATNPNIASIMEKYGGQVMYTRYRKELNNG